MSPDWLVGFVDGEGCFVVSLQVITGGLYARFAFSVVQKELDILQRARAFLGVGSIYPQRAGTYVWSVRKKKDLEIIIAFFRAHQLQSKKRLDFEKWAAAYGAGSAGRVKTREAAVAIDAIRVGMNSHGKLLRNDAGTMLAGVI